MDLKGKGMLVVLSGPSGSGKDTVLEKLKESAFSFDKKEGSIQRDLDFEKLVKNDGKNSTDKDKEKSQTASGKEKLLTILLAAAVIVIAGLLVWLLVIIAKRSRRR